MVKGRGLPSRTDLMVEYSDSCIAIESKWTEPAYQTVTKWLGNIPNRKLVLEGWLEIINNHLQLEIKISEVGDLPYQLIHRVASACALKKKKTHIFYLAFELNKKKEQYYSNSLSRFSSILKHKANLHLNIYNIEKSLVQEQLEDY